jgi:hypothetical protein
VEAYDGFEPTWDVQTQVNVDLEVIRGYGEAHLDEFGGHWLEDRHFYGVVFSESLAEHTTALEASVGFPERLRIGRCAYSMSTLRATARAIVDEEIRHADRGMRVTGVVGLGPRVQHNVVEVRVRPGHPEVEARLRATYGDLVSVVPGELGVLFSPQEATH